MKKSPLTIIFATVFIDLVGFGMIIPLSPYLAEDYGATSLQVGLLISIYSLMQIIFSPLWGRWSDRLGRRPIIIVSLIGTGLAHVAFAYSSSLWMLFVSRAFAGLFGANISTAMAYAADVTGPQERSKGLGLIGAAFGIGFIAGPFFGGVLGDVGMRIQSTPPFGQSFPALVAGMLCFINSIFAYFFLKESLSAESRQPRQPKARLEVILKYFRKPVTGTLLLINFLAVLSMAQMEPILFLLVKDRFGLSLSEASFAFAYVGVVMAITQGWWIRKLLPLWGERKLLVVGVLCSSLGIGLIGLAPTLFFLAFVVTLMAVGLGFRNTSLQGSISLTCSAQEQGVLMGVNQSLQALGRVLGPPIGGWLYGQMGAEVSFLTAGLIGFISLIFVYQIYGSMPDAAKKIEPEFNHSSKQVQTVTPVAQPVVVPERARTSRVHQPEPPKVEHVKKEDRLTVISAFQFRSLFTNNVSFLFFDLRPPEAQPKYSRAINTTEENLIEELNKRTQDKRHPLLILCEDGVLSRACAQKVADIGFINIVIVDGGAKSLNKTNLV